MNRGASFGPVFSATGCVRPRKSSGRPSATVTATTPSAFARPSAAPRIWEAESVAASSFIGAVYSRSDWKPRSDVAVARTRSSDMPPITSRGTAIATCSAAVTRCTRPTRRPPPPTSSFKAERMTGRLKRSAGSRPKATLAARHTATQMPMMAPSTRMASSNWYGRGPSIIQAMTSGI